MPRVLPPSFANTARTSANKRHLNSYVAMLTCMAAITRYPQLATL